jgi:hypothetical protein
LIASFSWKDLLGFCVSKKRRCSEPIPWIAPLHRDELWFDLQTVTVLGWFSASTGRADLAAASHRRKVTTK